MLYSCARRVEFPALRVREPRTKESDMRESVLLLLATGMLSCVSAYGETSLDWKWDGSERAEATPAQIAFEGSNELHLNLVSKAGASGVAYRGTCFVIR